MRERAAREGPFGPVRVVEDMVHRAHVLLHGDTFHGWQFRDDERLDEPTGYYAAGSPIARLVADAGPGAHVAVAGLGAGVMASLAAPGQRFTFFELDPAVVAIAHDPSLFSFLARSRGRCEVVERDALDGLLALSAAALDLVVMDAFVDDAVAPHVRTPAAVRGLLARLRPGAILAWHVTSTKRGDDLRPELARAAGEGVACASIDWRSDPLPRDPTLEIAPEVDLSAPVECRWVAMGGAARVASLAASGWTPLAPPA
jgi:hypothetical protein